MTTATDLRIDARPRVRDHVAKFSFFLKLELR
jgi:hypothetical protein